MLLFAGVTFLVGILVGIGVSKACNEPVRRPIECGYRRRLD